MGHGVVLLTALVVGAHCMTGSRLSGPCCVKFWQHGNYTGDWWEICSSPGDPYVRLSGTYDELEGANDKVSSLEFGHGITEGYIFEDHDFKGKRTRFHSPLLSPNYNGCFRKIANVDNAMNDKMTSFRFARSPHCEDPNPMPLLCNTSNDAWEVNTVWFATVTYLGFDEDNSATE